MATSTIKQVMNNSDSNYCKMPDGTLICWGIIPIPDATYGPFGGMFALDFTVDVPFPIPFISQPYVGSIGVQSAASFPFRIWCNSNKINYVSVMRQNANGASVNFPYIAIGRWK